MVRSESCICGPTGQAIKDKDTGSNALIRNMASASLINSHYSEAPFILLTGSALVGSGIAKDWLAEGDVEGISTRC